MEEPDFGQRDPTVEASLAITSVGESKQSCSTCHVEFSSGNSLHQHLVEANHAVPSPKNRDTESTSIVPKESESTNIENSDAASSVGTPADVFAAHAGVLIESTAAPVWATGYAFRGWQYAACDVSFQRHGPKKRICLDSGCTMTLGDRAFLKNNIWGFENNIRKTSSPIPVRGLGNKIHYSGEYFVVDMYFQGISNGVSSTAHIRREIHVVDDLKVNVLVGIDILASESMLLDFGKRTLCIGSCQNLVTDIDILSKSEPNLRRVVRAKSRITVSAHAFMEIPVHVKGSALPSDRDFFFEPSYSHDLGRNGGLYTHIVDASLSMVQLKNESDKPVTIQRHARLGEVTEYNGDGCFMVNPEEHPLAAAG